MIFYGHFSISLLHFLVGSARIDFEDLVIAVVARPELRDDRISLSFRKTYICRNRFKDIDFPLLQAVTCTERYKEMKQLQALGIIHARADLRTHFVKIEVLLQDILYNFLCLFRSLRSEIPGKELPESCNFLGRSLSVSLYHGGRQDQKAHEKTVSLSLIPVLFFLISE